MNREYRISRGWRILVIIFMILFFAIGFYLLFLPFIEEYQLTEK